MRRKVLSVILTCTLLVGLAPEMVSVNAQTTKEALNAQAEKTIENDLLLEEEFDEADTRDNDGDGLINYWEDSIGTDKNCKDTDNDGLSDYEEVVLVGTDPCEKDTDANGISDAKEDADGDGICNIDEINLGTDPLNVDTDNDGLKDAYEVEKLNTDPTAFDTDGDGVSDSFEKEMSEAGYSDFDPNKSNDEFTFEVTTEDGECTLEVTAEGPVVETVEVNKNRESLEAYDVSADGDLVSATLVTDETEVEVTEAGTYSAIGDAEYTQLMKNSKKALKEYGVKIAVDKNGYINMLPNGLHDSNNDGICDKLTKLLCNGTILTADGELAFGDYTYKQVKSNADVDNDGILNGEEVKIKYENGIMFAVLTSDPAEKDTDGDGIPDSEDTAPFDKGLEGGIVGSLQIVGSHKPDAVFSDGHAFLVYTSYIDGQELTVNNMFGSYDFNYSYQEAIKENKKLLSWRSLVDDCTEDNEAARQEIADDMWQYRTGKDTYIINRDEYVTIGNFTQSTYAVALKDAMKYSESGTMVEMVALQAMYEFITGEKVDLMYVMSHLAKVAATVAGRSFIGGEDVLDGNSVGGIWVNREMYDQRFQYDQYPHEIYEVEITQDEYDAMVACLNENNYYSMLCHNCSSVATRAWNAAVGYERDDNGQLVKSSIYLSARGKGLLKIMDFPGGLNEHILEIKDTATRGKYYSENSAIVAGYEGYTSSSK